MSSVTLPIGALSISEPCAGPIQLDAAQCRFLQFDFDLVAVRIYGTDGVIVFRVVINAERIPNAANIRVPLAVCCAAYAEAKQSCAKTCVITDHEIIVGDRTFEYVADQSNGPDPRDAFEIGAPSNGRAFSVEAIAKTANFFAEGTWMEIRTSGDRGAPVEITGKRDGIAVTAILWPGDYYSQPTEPSCLPDPSLN